MVAPLDWDKLRIFHAAAEAGSFTHAAQTLHLSQSAISRQVSALEQDVGVPLFHRHARGLILTEQGETLYRTAHDVLMKLENVRSRLAESKEKPTGRLRVTTTVGLGSGWLIERVQQGMASQSYTVGPIGASEVCLRSFAAKIRNRIPEARLHHAPPPGWSRRPRGV